MCSEIESMAINGPTEVTGTTVFVSEACEQVDVGAGHSLMVTNGNIQDLTAYFARPVSVFRGVLPNGTVGSVNSRVTSKFLDLELFPNGASRMTGVAGFTATRVFTLQVASTPFHQGLLAMSYQYSATNNTDVDRAYAFDRGGFPELCTNLPHVRLDLAEGTMVQLRVPFMASVEYVSFGSIDKFLDNSVDFGKLTLSTILPIQAVAGTSAPTYHLYMHYEDVKLYGVRPAEITTVEFQAGKTVNGISSEFANDAYPFSSATYHLSKTVKYVSKGIPMLSSIGGTTSWFLEKAAGAIRAFGYSRPQIAEPSHPTHLMDNAGEYNVDRALPINVVAATSSNYTRTGPEFAGTNVDEMSLAHILSKKAQIARFSYTTAAAAGATLYYAALSPSCMWFRTSSIPVYNRLPRLLPTATTNAFIPTSFFYFGQMFKYWKGSFKFKFTFSKTKLHGGRVMVAFCPYITSPDEGELAGDPLPMQVASYGSALGADPTGLSAVFNLRDGNEFEFAVPYTSDRPYLPFLGSYGTIVMYVVDPIQAPSVVSNTIDVLVEVSADSDFEFADPRTPMYPAHPKVSRSTIMFQSGKIISQSKDNHCEFTMGETLNSVKQLIAIPKCTVDFIPNDGDLVFTVPPWYYTPSPSVLIPSATSCPHESFSIPGMVAKAFAFAKGGTDVHVYSSARTDFLAHIRQISTTDALTNANDGPDGDVCSNNIRVFNGLNGTLHARLPSYQSKTRFSPAVFDNVMPTGASWSLKANRIPEINDIWDERPPLYRLLVKGGSRGGLIFVNRAASEDACLSQYIGPVPLFLRGGELGAYDLDMVNL